MGFQHITNNVYYLPGPSNVGLVVGEGQRAVLIDTGVGRRSGRRLLRLLDEQNLRLEAILNTHCHGDHVGGNAYLVEHTGARVYAPLYDAVMLQYPWWGTMCMFGGADPPAELRAPRFSPQPSPVDVIVAEGEIDVAGIRVEAVSLPGHTGTHTGYVVSDVFFLGDALPGDAELSSSALSYAYSVTRWLESLEKLRHIACAYYVLGHGGIERHISPLVERSFARAEETLLFIKEYAAEKGAAASEIMEAVCQHHDMEIRTIKQYFRWYPVVHAFLSHLSNAGEIAHEVKNNQLLWHTVKGGDI